MKKKQTGIGGRSFWRPGSKPATRTQKQSPKKLAAQLRHFAELGKLTLKGKQKLQQLKGQGY